jgi:hypothetical protein
MVSRYQLSLIHAHTRSEKKSNAALVTGKTITVHDPCPYLTATSTGEKSGLRLA